jgi:hypothetical protein
MAKAKKDPIFNFKRTSIEKLISKPVKPVNFLIQFIIAAAKLISLVSAGGTGKTQIAMQMAFSIMTAEPFLGIFEVFGPGVVLIICTEETKQELVARLKTILEHHLAKIEDEEKKESERERLTNLLKERARISYVGTDENFCFYPDESSPSSTQRVKRFCYEELEDSVKMIIIDNQSQLMLGEHNSTSAAALYMKKCVALAKDTNATVLNLAHTNKSSETNDLEVRLAAQSLLGSVSYINIPRMILTMTRLKATDKITLPESIKLSDVVAMKIAKSNLGNTLVETIFLRRCVNGVLELISVQEFLQEQEFIEITKIIEANPTINQTSLIEEIMKGLGKSKRAAANLLNRCVDMEIVLLDRQTKNNACLYTFDKEKRQELYEQIKIRNNKINDHLGKVA